MVQSKSTILAELRSDILRMQGFKPSALVNADMGLGFMRHAFPNKSFPTACVHEFLSNHQEESASTCGFVNGILGSLLNNSGAAVWISTKRKLFPPALKNFGINPDHIVFVDLQKEKHMLWAMEEALKCNALTAVIGEINEIDFTASRRLQLAVEESQVTGFILRNTTRKLSTTACVSRWKITSLPSMQIDDLPGVGYPAWHVALLRMRNGNPGEWDVYWKNGKLNLLDKQQIELTEQQLNVG